MKKHIVILLASLLLISSAVYAGVYFVNYSDTLAASANVTASGGYLSKVMIAGDGASTCTFNLYDSAGTGTTNEIMLTLIVTTSESRYLNLPFNPSVEFFKGLYAVISSTGEMKVYWRNE